ncbi:4-alpha-glucanotransferase [Acidocella sp.]|uniref:4-alpha-glucanotransferase n=1 Tax=Acidocella sp. TaxID=50710 RepID=UPI0026168C71|nr:4-alpha-glucanotransferase [Acidocella sp.]
MQTVSDASLRAILEALGEDGEARSPPPLVTSWLDEPVLLPCRPGAARLRLEDGATMDMTLEEQGRQALLPAIGTPGYHRLETRTHAFTVAVAPRRGFSLEDAGQGAKLWGLTVQLYALRRARDGGIGDFEALKSFAQAAAKQGASALLLSPVHAMFTSDVTRYAPYSPSSRVALNVLHIAREGRDEAGDLIDWPAASRRKLALLRRDFEVVTDWRGLEAFRAQGGVGLERHAIFEALAEHFGALGGTSCDWRTWPEAYRDPDSSAVRDFMAAHAQTVAFHAWLQWRAAQGLAGAQNAMRGAGARIGLIADLAVGTDPSGSHCWSRQDEVLGGLELGAPPDLFNREGQGWGITAFSPAGLRRSGFAGFLEMVRHALHHAGGLRVDHALGLMRLWVIPPGRGPAEGAYLAMPFPDLLRLLVLESHRHRAVLVGEDLGTVPAGFQPQLAAAGIGGMRVMWFERTRSGFRAPARWTPEAAAMTTTHDLPTVAGWWTGRDLEWRARLGLAAESKPERAAARRALWTAFRKSGATSAPQPAEDDPLPVTAAASQHIGKTACHIALLPVEDALSSREAPNLPGSTTEHPNWRRRLPGTAQELFSRPDLRARLAALHTARQQVS